MNINCITGIIKSINYITGAEIEGNRNQKWTGADISSNHISGADMSNIQAVWRLEIKLYNLIGFSMLLFYVSEKPLSKNLDEVLRSPQKFSSIEML